MSDRETPELLAGFQNGDDDALQQVVGLYQKELFLFALRMVRNEGDAEEVVQETFLRAYRSRARFRGDSALRTWLYRITKNLCLNLIRKRTREDVTEDTGAEAGGDSALEGMLNDEQVRLTRTAVDQLPEKQRLILTLRVYQEKSLREIAEIVGSPLGTVKANLFHATKNLKKKLAPLYPEEVKP